MQKIPIDKAAEGMVLAKPIERENGVVLMGEGTELNEQIIERLKGLDIQKITVKGRPLGGEDEKPVEVLYAEHIDTKPALGTEAVYRIWITERVQGLRH